VYLRNLSAKRIVRAFWGCKARHED